MSADLLKIVPEIQKEINKRHKEFTETYGGLADKLMAEHQLQADIIFTRLFRIMVCFKEEKIIDDALIVEQIPTKKLYISKNGSNNYIYVTTNGRTIWLEGFTSSFDDFISDRPMDKKRILGVDEEDFDWLQFSLDFLDYVHTIIYERKEVTSLRISKLLDDNNGME